MSDPNGPMTHVDGATAAEASNRERFFGAGEGAGAAASMDPAHQSLASALRLLFLFIQGLLILLILGFLASGFQTVGESERGVKLTLGEISRSDLAPGVQWSWPYPIGELEKIRVGQETLEVVQPFWPAISPQRRGLNWGELAQLGARRTLDPAQAGSIITADLNIAHVRWTVLYSRVDPALNAENIYKPDEEAMIRAAIQRGAVRAVAGVTIDELLKRTPRAGGGGGLRLAARVRQIAQDTLDAMGSGIRLDDVILRDGNPPLQVYRQFDAVATAEATAAKQREDASRLRRETLNAAGGDAHDILLDRIDAYEAAVDAGDEDRADTILATIERILDEEPVEIDGEAYDPVISGEAASILNAARQYRTNLVASARSRARTFEAKLERFRTEPAVLMTSDWRDAYREFLDDGAFEVMVMPPGSKQLEVLLNSDPAIRRQLEQERNVRQVEQTIEQRQQKIREAQREREEQRREDGQ